MQYRYHILLWLRETRGIGESIAPPLQSVERRQLRWRHRVGGDVSRCDVTARCDWSSARVRAASSRRLEFLEDVAMRWRHLHLGFWRHAWLHHEYLRRCRNRRNKKFRKRWNVENKNKVIKTFIMCQWQQHGLLLSVSTLFKSQKSMTPLWRFKRCKIGRLSLKWPFTVFLNNKIRLEL